ncbi:hypothetical protein KSS87_009831 [Heliosperma pusillum]|nr:hypothetical protein KSS87_009831 [Heliosperma pusillum]
MQQGKENHCSHKELQCKPMGMETRKTHCSTQGVVTMQKKRK